GAIGARHEALVELAGFLRLTGALERVRQTALHRVREHAGLRLVEIATVLGNGRLEVTVPEGVVARQAVRVESAERGGVLRVDLLRQVERARVVALPEVDAGFGQLTRRVVLLRGAALEIQVAAEPHRDDDAEGAERQALVLLPPRGDADQDLGPL